MTVLRFVSVFAAVALLTFHVSAATVSWVGSSGDWNIATNWSTGALPGAADDVVIDRPGALTITHSAGAHTVRSIQSEEALTVSGGSLTVSNTVQVNAPFHLAGANTVAAASVPPAR